jgi:hypothetical protein
MIKTTQKRVNIGDSDGKMAALFNQLLGTGDINMTIAYPRYIRIKDYCTKLVSLFEIIAKSPYMRHTDSRDEILSFCVRGSARIQALFYMDFTAYEWNLSTVDEELQKKFVANYRDVKSCDIINTFITMLAALAPYRKSFENIDKLSSRFLTGMSGVEWRPFPFTSLNMKAIFDDPDAKANTRDCFMSLLHKSYDFARLLHTELSSPDVDVEQFSVAIIDSIEKLKKRPELQRCDQAFAKIKESIGMLKGNFNKYYADFVDTKDSTIMMQNFVADVASTTKANSAVTFQFRKIIGYYSKMAREQPKDESTNMLFQKVDAAFGQMGKNSMPDAVDLVEDHDSTEICVFDASAKSLSEVLAPIPEPRLSRVSTAANANATNMPAEKSKGKPVVKKAPIAKKIQVSKPQQKAPRGGKALACVTTTCASSDTLVNSSVNSLAPTTEIVRIESNYEIDTPAAQIIEVTQTVTSAAAHTPEDHEVVDQIVAEITQEQFEPDLDLTK